jgi:hypothetical protein
MTAEQIEVCDTTFDAVRLLRDTGGRLLPRDSDALYYRLVSIVMRARNEDL